RMVRDSMLSAVKVTAMISFIIFGARLLSFVFQDLGATAKISGVVLSLDLGKYATMLCIVILYLILGMFFDSMAMMLLTLSFVLPIIVKLGYDPVWWGVTFVLLAEIGLVTPPFGLNLFTIHGVLPKFSVMFIARASLPFLAVMILMVWILIFFPDLAMWLPGRRYEGHFDGDSHTPRRAVHRQRGHGADEPDAGGKRGAHWLRRDCRLCAQAREGRHGPRLLRPV